MKKSIATETDELSCKIEDKVAFMPAWRRMVKHRGDNPQADAALHFKPLANLHAHVAVRVLSLQHSRGSVLAEIRRKARAHRE